ncbi:MAG: hypothetical protein QOH60_607 [Mycobacterium sp.]|jgi:hypothetical protein|nr:hypothetical protein [Mycobacterium sp.]
MTTTEEKRRFLPPVQCAPWCTDGNGHVTETGRADQTCWGSDHYVALSLEETSPAHLPPVEHQYLDMDSSVLMTADEARRYAAQLIEVADEIDREAKR